MTGDRTVAGGTLRLVAASRTVWRLLELPGIALSWRDDGDTSSTPVRGS